MLEIEISKSGISTLKYNNKYIHSKYNPVKESENFIKSKMNLLKKNVIVVYGTGLGYHVREILKQISGEDKKIYLFEHNQELIKLFKKYNEKLVMDKRLRIIDSKNSKFYYLLSKVLKDVDDIIIHKGALEIIKEENKELYNLFYSYERDRMLINKYASLLNENYEKNLKLNCESISKLIKQKLFKKKWILVSAGPSLDLEISKLKALNEIYNIISVGTAARTLVENNIMPNIVVIIDGSDLIKKQFDGINDIDSILCFLSTASNVAVKKYSGKRYIFFNEKNNDEIIIETGKTVAVAALNIAIKLGAEEIVFLGQDLGYINGRSHIKLLDQMYNKKNEIIINENSPKVLDINGEYIYTNKGYLHFKEQIEKVIKKNKNIKFINCSKGALINGCTNLDLNQIIKK